MAYIEGYPGDKTGRSAGKHIGLVVISVVMVIGLMLYYSEDWRGELPTILVIATAIIAIMLVVSYKISPMAWKKMFARASYEEMMRLDRMVADTLDLLDDNYFIFHDMTFELFHIENLVISTRGMFVVAKIKEKEPLHVEHNILHAGDTPLDTLTGNVWRICHLINIVYKKTYKEEIMPKPMLVVPDADTVDLDNFEGIAILPLNRLKRAIEKDTKDIIRLEIAQSFAYYIKKSYA